MEQGGLIEPGLPFMHEVDQAHRTVDERHPDFRPDLAGCSFVLALNAGAFDAVPNHLLARSPFDEPFHAPRHIPEVAGHLRVRMRHRVDVERDDIAAGEVFRVILGMIGAHAAAIPSVPGHALAEVEHDRARRIGRPELQVVLHDGPGGDGRAIALRAAERLGIVGFVPVHPANNRRVIQMAARRRVLVADYLHACRFQGRELAFRRPLPKPHVGVKARGAVLAGVARVLQPNGDREEPGVMGRPMFPFGIRTRGG